jgi:hypothetical protein
VKPVFTGPEGEALKNRLVAAGVLLGLGVFFAAATTASADTYSGYGYWEMCYK